ncbi:YopX family protein [Streptococcus sp. Marseille-P8640]|uniref:YopX family protein n=1 Tax=Streptococcus sp. Marseille-P8640 TaxID=2866596 RepID=UPI0023B96BAC|nr:YopX family protein [Streptococcus sp. Marseille-P8640]
MVGNCDTDDENWTCPIIWIEERQDWLHFDDYDSIMQSTGLKDKNGKEIFEGDIVKMAKDVYSEPNYYEVVRHRGGAYRLESKQHGCELWLRHTDCEVVGNIYENKELLDA